MTIDKYKELPVEMLKLEIKIIDAKLYDLDQEKAKVVVVLEERKK